MLTVLLFCACEAQNDSSSFVGYGESFDILGALPVEAVLAEQHLYVNARVSIEGTVHAVCQHDGCWFILRSVGGQDLRVDVERTTAGAYVYTLPRDISGRRAVARGVLVSSRPSQAEQAHLEGEGAGGATLVLSAAGVMIAEV